MLINCMLGGTPTEWQCGNETILKSDPEFCSYNCSLTSHHSTIVSEVVHILG